MSKGRLLTKEEILKLKDGTEVWVEDNYEFYSSDVFTKSDNKLKHKTDQLSDWTIKGIIGDDLPRIKVYEWIEEKDKSKSDLKDNQSNTDTVEPKINQQIWKDFINNKIVINCKTEEECEAFLKYCHSKGLTWGSKDPLYPISYSVGSDTCYEKEEDGLFWGDLEFFTKLNKKNIEIVNYSNLFQNIKDNIKENTQSNTYKGSEILAMIEEDKLEDDDIVINTEGEEVFIEDIRNGEYNCCYLLDYAPFTIGEKIIEIDYITAINSNKNIRPMSLRKEKGFHPYTYWLGFMVSSLAHKNKLLDLINGQWEIES